MIINEEFLTMYEALSKLNDIDKQTLLDEAFDNEEVHGEAAKTIPGLLRYFVAHIETLANVIERGRILASTGESKSSNSGNSRGKKLPFVSFSHQLFSHAYRRGSVWKYGVIVDQNKLEQKVQSLNNTTIEDNFVHQNKSSRVFGAAKLANGAEMLITSYGSFEMNLSDEKRKALGDIPHTNYYEKVKTSFNARLAAEREKYADGHAKSISAEDFYCSDSVDFIKRYLKIDVDVVEGFLLVNRLQSTSIKFTDICKDVPGLFNYLQEYTTANEGELRVWLPKDQKYLDISGCIVGIALPSNYKENNLDNPENTAPDVVWLRKLIAEKNLTVYVYQSKDETNIPDLDYSRKHARTLEKLSIMEYFHKITSSREAVIDFIKNELTRYKLYKGGSCANLYVAAVAKNTTSAADDIRTNQRYSYRAFLEAIKEHNLTNKDVNRILQLGEPLADAQEVFKENTKSAEAVQSFLMQLVAEYPGQRLDKAYSKWFIDNTNACYVGGGPTSIRPSEVLWFNFINYCKQNFNYSSRDLTALSKGMQAIDRLPIKDLFKQAAATNKKTTLKYVKNFAIEQPTTIAQAYNSYMGKHAIDTSVVLLQKDTNVNFKAWLEKVTDPNGPVKLTKEEVLNYFKEFKAEAANNK